jgi:hypothetical protein
MHNLRKQLSFLLLSGLVVLYSLNSSADYSNPFIPVYVSGDDMSEISIKPKTMYVEVKESKIVISNMPAYKTQDDIGDCKAFSLATVVQKYTCDKWKSDIPDCKNPPSDSAISYMGMMAYTNQVPEQSNSFQPNQKNGRSMSDIINDLSKNGNKLILDSCKPFDSLVNNFSLNGKSGLEKRDIFFNYLKKMYENKKSKTEADIADCPECIAEINKNSGLNVNLLNLKKALSKDTYDKFLYSLFFDGCQMENFPSGFRAAVYPLDSMNVGVSDIKNQIVKGLKQGRPVLFPSLCVSQDKGDECKGTHSLVVSGYKKVCEFGSTTKCKDVFKLHNSWGADWQKKNNDGWVDADVFAQNTVKTKSSSGGYRVDSSSVIWLDP